MVSVRSVYAEPSMSIQTHVSPACASTRSTFATRDVVPEVQAEMRELQGRRHGEPPPARLLDQVAVDVGGRGRRLRLRRRSLRGT